MMRFILFSKLPFMIKDPIGLIECYCYQNDFYDNYDAIPDRTLKDVNKIGARIDPKLLQESCPIVEAVEGLKIYKFQHDLDNFLRQKDIDIEEQVKELDEQVIQPLTKISGIKLSKASKILHTLYPELIPMIDDQLQTEYHHETNQNWCKEISYPILLAYYYNLREDENWQNLEKLSQTVNNHNLHLTRLRIFDILWWSYLKAKRLREKRNIRWESIQ